MIAQETIERVREQTGLVELIAESVKLERRGRNFTGLCPFHKEKTPSFHVNEERGTYHCFGCAAHGDAIRFVQETEGLDFVEAVRRLAERSGIPIVENASSADRQRHDEAKRREQALFDVNNGAAQYFERMLTTHPLADLARAELKRRGLESEAATDSVADTLQAFRIGYAPLGWDGLSRYLRDQGFSLSAAEQVGLVVPRKSGGGYYDRFRHRLMFGVLDLQGRVIAFSGRALEDPSAERVRGQGLEPRESDAEPPAKYMNSPESAIYKKREAVFGLFQARQAVRTSAVSVVVEGNFDVVSLHARGLKNVVAPLGTAFTAEQAKQLKRFAPAVTLLFDGDSAGRRAASAAREPAQQAGLFVKVAALPDGIDPDELARTQGPDAVQSVLKAAKGLLEYLIDSALDPSFLGLDVKSRGARVNEVANLIGTEPDPTVRALAEQRALSRLAGLAAVVDPALMRAFHGAIHRAAVRGAGQSAGRDTSPSGGASRGAGGVSPGPRDGSGVGKRDPRQRIEEGILGALLDYPELLDTPEVMDGVEHVEGECAAAIAALRQCLSGTKLISHDQVLAKMAPSIHPFALARLAAPRHESLEDAKAELLENVKKLKRLTLARDKSLALEELQKIEAGDFDTELALLREQHARARERHGL